MCEGAGGGAFVARVAAADRNAGHAGNVTCSLATPTTGAPRFKLLPVPASTSQQAEYRLVTGDAADFDRETTDRYGMTIVCEDDGTPPLSANATLDVLVLDVNDHEPRLSRPHYVFRVPENDRPGAWIGSVAATDPDLGANGSVSFHLEPRDADTPESSPVIQIDPETGIITLQAGT